MILRYDLMYTIDDLKTMQAWPIERKVRASQIHIIGIYQKLGGKISVSFSGGKDSVVLLDLARRCYPDMPAVFVDTGLEYPEVRSVAINTPNVTVMRPKIRFDEVVKTHGWCFPSKDMAEAIEAARRNVPWALRMFIDSPQEKTRPWRKKCYQKWKFLIGSPFKISDKCCDIIKTNPIKSHQRITGAYNIYGARVEEGRRRKNSWLQHGCNVFNSKHPSSRPLSFWTNQDILWYIKTMGLPIASVYGEIVHNKKGLLTTTGEQHTGCMFCPIGSHLVKENKFIRMKVSHPKLYNYCMETLGLGEFLDYLKIPH